MSMTEEQKQERKLMLLCQEKDKQKSQWWLSFCDPRKPNGKQFLGVVVVEAQGFMHANQLAWTLGINPGGEVQESNVTGVPAEYHNRLLSRDEAIGLL